MNVYCLDYKGTEGEGEKVGLGGIIRNLHVVASCGLGREWNPDLVYKGWGSVWSFPPGWKPYGTI